MDTKRRQIYPIPWPAGGIIHYDIEKDKLKDLGPFSAKREGETVGEDYCVLCRSIVVDPVMVQGILCAIYLNMIPRMDLWRN